MSASPTGSPHRPPRFFLRPSRLHLEAEPAWAELDPDQIHRLRRVLRLGVGAQVILFDGSGREYPAEVRESRPTRVRLQIFGWQQPAVESPLRITLAQSLLKGNAFDRVLTDATELGVHAVVPILSSRTVARPRPREAEAKVRRWEKILAAAAEQSGRVRVPRLDYPTVLEDFLRHGHPDLKLLLWEKAPVNCEWPDCAGTEVVLLVGPEGGFAESEAAAAIEAGFRPLRLGPRILRGDTAGPAALAVLQHRYGDFK